jgi:type I restriction enzyme, S subunit
LTIGFCPLANLLYNKRIFYSNFAMTLTRFADVVTLSSTRTADPLAAGIERFVGLEHIEPDNLHIRSWGNVADGITFTSTFKSGQVLFGKRRAYQRKVAVADFDGVCSSDIYVFESKDPNVLLPELLPFICQSVGFYQYAIKTSAGSLSPRTNWTHLANYEFPLPPMDEQRRIADLLWAADDAIIEYSNVVEQIQKTKDSFIANSLTGNRPFRTLDDFIQNSQWEMVKLDNVCLQITDGTHVTPEYVATGIPFLRVTDIQETKIDWKSVKYIKPEVHEQYIKRCHPQKGDILLSKNGTIGLVKVVDWDEPFSIFVSLCMLKPKRNLNASYLAELIRTQIVQMQFSKRAKQGTVTNLHLEEIRECLIPLPPVSEQEEFVKKARQFDETREQAIKHLENTQNLKKSLLTKYLAS